jgi:hypothetical protein
LKAEIPVGLADDPECEGFTAKGLRTSKAGNVHPIYIGVRGTGMATPFEGNDKRLGRPETLVSNSLKNACPKTPDKSLIQTALKFKGFKGSVVMERICCGKPGCRCQNGALHGPYPYLHYYSNGKVRRRYLSKTVSMLLSHSTEDLERMLHETQAVLGQEQREASHD